jgi:hypothetical protein
MSSRAWWCCQPDIIDMNDRAAHHGEHITKLIKDLSISADHDRERAVDCFRLPPLTGASSMLTPRSPRAAATSSAAAGAMALMGRRSNLAGGLDDPVRP